MKDKKIFVLGVVVLVLILLFGCAAQAQKGLAAKAVQGGIEVSWEPSGTSVVGYNVYRSTESGTLGDKVNPTMVTDTSYTDTTVQNGVTYYYTVRSVSSGGSENSNTGQVSATGDTEAPEDLQIEVGGGDKYARSTDVTLSLSADGASQCRYSNDGNTWSDWSSYTTSKSWTLSSGDGNKDVYYQCKDGVGNTAMPVSATVYLDSTPPTISVTSPEQGKEYGEKFDLTFTVTDPISNTVTCTGDMDGNSVAIGVVDVGKEDTTQLTADPGSHTFKISCTDQVLSADKTISFTVTAKPSVSVHIESGAGYVAKRQVTLDVTAPDGGQCRFSNDGTTWNSYSPHSSTVQWTLSSGDGTKYVYVQCKDSSGVASDVVSDSVILDTRPPPYIFIKINDDEDWTNRKDVTLGLHCFAADECRYSNDEQHWSDWSSYTTSKSWTLSSGEGKKYVYYECNDENGNDLGHASNYIYYSEIPPNPPTELRMDINGGDSHTTNKYVDLDLHAKHANQCRFRQSGGDWTSWEDYQTEKSWKITGDYGKKTIYYECKNDYGNKQIHDSIYYDSKAPPAINDLSASADSDSIHLSWSRVKDSSGISGYYIYRGTSSSGPLHAVGHTGGTTYKDDNVVEGNTYYYSVRAKDNSGNEGPNSNYAHATVKKSGPPGKVTDLDAEALATSIDITWSAPSDKGSGIDYYNIYRSTHSLGMFSKIDTSQSGHYKDTTVIEGEGYSYSVRAVDTNGKEAEDSNIASADCCLSGGGGDEPIGPGPVIPNESSGPLVE